MSSAQASSTSPSPFPLDGAPEGLWAEEPAQPHSLQTEPLAQSYRSCCLVRSPPRIQHHCRCSLLSLEAHPKMGTQLCSTAELLINQLDPRKQYLL